MTKMRLSFYWLVLAVSCLAVSGLLTLGIASSRMPWFSSLFTDPLEIRRLLVVHVDLGVSVWFTAMPIALLLFFRSETVFSKLANVRHFSALGLSLIGVILIFVGGLVGGGEPVLANYVPVVDNQMFLCGVALHFIGCALAALDWPTIKGLFSKNPIEVGVAVGSLYLIAAVAALAYAPFQSKPEIWPSSLALGATAPQTTAASNTSLPFFEMMMWAGGHLLQFVNATFMVVVWIFVLSTQIGDAWIKSEKTRYVFYWLLIPLLIASGLIFLDPTDYVYREGFTNLMRWGIFPPVLFFLFTHFKILISKHKENQFWLRDLRGLGFLLSVFLILTGFVFGFSIRGQDLRVPGHYHESIGAVSMAYTLAALLLFASFAQTRLEVVMSTKTARWHAYLYGFGQWLFGAGMFLAGLFGMTRKTYGVEQTVKHPMQPVGMGIMGIGGLVAIIGALYFFLVIQQIYKTKKGRNS